MKQSSRQRRKTGGTEAAPKRGFLSRFGTKSQLNLRTPLCNTCLSLGLVAPPLPSPRTPTTPMSMNSNSWVFPASPVSTSSGRYSGTVSIGSYNDLMERSECPFCQLVLHLVRKKGEAPALVGGSEGPSWSPTTKYQLRRSGDGFEVREGLSTLGYVCPAGEDVPVAPPAASSGNSSPILDCTLIKKWIGECEEKHVNCALLKEYTRSNDALDLILVDVKNNRIVKGNTNQRYIALSYVRGNVKMLQTLKENFNTLRRDTALEPQKQKLPKVVLDAMKLVSQLGERYLWVDTLSIVQDDFMRKTAQINNMNRIYGKALFTIVAAAARDAGTSLHGVNAGTRLPYVVEETIDGKRFVARPANLRTILNQGCYGTRAWTYTERLLSHRCLILTPHQAYFQCPEAVRTDADASKPDMIHPELDVPSNPLLMIQMERAMTQKMFADTFDEGGFLIYDELVRSFTRRALSNPMDKLLAFAGVGAALKENYNSNFVNALPEVSLDAALLWISIKEEKETAGPDRFVQRSRFFPSWSWASQPGCVDYLSGPLNYTLLNGGPGIESDIGTIFIRKQKRLRPLNRQFGDLIRRAKTTTPAPRVEDMPTPFLFRDVDTLYFCGVTASLDQFRLRQSERDRESECLLLFSKILSPAKSQLPDQHKCCGKIWVDDMTSFLPPASASLDPNDEPLKRDLVLLSSTMVPHVGEHLDIKAEFATEEFRDDGEPLMNVMVIEWHGEYAERLGVAQIHGRGWRAARTVRKIVVLA
ncbi:heterokaryon incompatibility protein-domain-containing protein [Clohesyomyces aquaticus]|uniref:Heterokaryon incompatibility protein-domain-containing protein n=1 Tax=Clohesyomyces aquaticus TaxID=1231657 RepID=A0A1Y1ZSE6_9PLEO|nr:heterokaryon incompatibility protein-domain-containing protein [Clohesyomyces aquaticus]